MPDTVERAELPAPAPPLPDEGGGGRVCTSPRLPAAVDDRVDGESTVGWSDAGCAEVAVRVLESEIVVDERESEGVSADGVDDVFDMRCRSRAEGVDECGPGYDGAREGGAGS